MPYTVKIRTGDEKDMGTDSNAFIRIMGPKKKHSGKLYLELAQKKGFDPGSVETFSLESVDVGDIKQIEVCVISLDPECLKSVMKDSAVVGALVAAI